MIERYQVRRDRDGFTVLDIWTAEPAVLALTSQSGLTREDADHTAKLLNHRAAEGERMVRQ